MAYHGAEAYRQLKDRRGEGKALHFMAVAAGLNNDVNEAGAVSWWLWRSRGGAALQPGTGWGVWRGVARRAPSTTSFNFQRWRSDAACAADIGSNGAIFWTVAWCSRTLHPLPPSRS